MDFSLDRRSWLKMAAGTAGAAGLLPAAATTLPPDGKADFVIDRAGAGPDYGAALMALRDYVDQHRAAYGLPGLVVAVADADGFSAIVCAGFADIETSERVTPTHVFQIGSISKSLAGLLVLRLVDQGRLHLDQDVRTLLPEIAWPAGAPITLQHLLTHSSGLPDDAPLFGHTAAALWRGFEPGSHFSYSNTGYRLLGLLVEKFQGCPYHQALGALLAELGMTGALPRILVADRPLYARSYQPYFTDRPYPRRGRLAPAPGLNMAEASGCVAATARQMAAYVTWLIRTGQGQSTPLLSEHAVKLFTTPAIKAPDFGPEAHYAMGLAILPIDGHDCLHHTGGMVSFDSAITVDPTAGVGAFASVNARVEESYRPREVTAYACRLFRAAREGRPLPAAPALKSPTKWENAHCVIGQYDEPAGDSILLFATGDGLSLQQGSASLPLSPVGDGAFIVIGPGDQSSTLLMQPYGAGLHSIGWGDRLYHPKGVAPPAPVLTPDQAACAGVYDSNNVWNGQVAIMARADGLWLDGTAPLIALEDGSYRVGAESWSPERITFDGIVNGKPQRLTFSGNEFYRI